MKLGTREAAAFVAKPDRGAAGVLIHGQDPMRVALKRQDLVANLLGAGAEADMRLTRLTGAELRSDPARLIDSMTSSGFFGAGGPRAVLVEDATDGLTDVFDAALSDWREGDGMIVATARSLNARSKLRKLFEGAKTAYAIAVYDDPPDRQEIARLLTAAGVGEVGREAMGDIEALARGLGPGDFRQTLDKLALYTHGQGEPVSPADVAAVAPLTAEAEIDDILDAVAGAEPGQVGPLVARLGAQGTAPVALCIAVSRHFRQLHAVATHEGGPAQGIAALRPPVFGPRRDRMMRQAGAWGRDRLEYALTLLVDTDLALRSSARAPQMAVMERALIRLAMLPRSRG
ncbi:DNA polymerase III subunit delta [Rhodobacterales bacterium HKCCE3408]|nr:DNA polymerase III subunit delta [Rhodobacterales bacterium HKCCE3408]